LSIYEEIFEGAEEKIPKKSRQNRQARQVRGFGSGTWRIDAFFDFFLLRQVVCFYSAFDHPNVFGDIFLSCRGNREDGLVWAFCNADSRIGIFLSGIFFVSGSLADTDTFHNIL
jgi:hypothetical protein